MLLYIYIYVCDAVLGCHVHVFVEHPCKKLMMYFMEYMYVIYIYATLYLFVCNVLFQHPLSS